MIVCSLGSIFKFPSTKLELTLGDSCPPVPTHTTPAPTDNILLQTLLYMCVSHSPT